MGEHLALPGRLSVRTPMQWTSRENGGFSIAQPEQFVRPILSGGDYGYVQVNVDASRSDRDSLLNWMAGLIRVRRECSEIGLGKSSILKTGSTAVLGLRYDDGHSTIVTLNNLSPQRKTVTLDLAEQQLGTAVEIFNDRAYGSINPERPRLRIEGYGYRWLRLGRIS